MLKKISILTLIILIVVFSNQYLSQTFSFVDKSIGFTPKMVSSFVVENLNNDSIGLSWSIPNYKLHNKIELYSGSSVQNCLKGVGKKNKLNSKNQSTLIKRNIGNERFFSIYSVDRFGRYSKPKIVYVNNKETKIRNINLDNFLYDYNGNKLRFFVQKLENEFMIVYLSRGVVISIENKISSKKVLYSSFNFLNSYLTPMDITGINSNSEYEITFSLYRSNYVKKDLSYINYDVKSENQITYLRRYYDSDDEESITYKLNGKVVEIDFKSNSKIKKYNIRLNFLGDENYKSITSWESQNVKSIIQEKEFDNTPKHDINKQYSIFNKLNYIHEEDFYNDFYPYHKSRKFLKIDSTSVFNLFNNGTKIFSIRDVSDNFFFYKNCSGEECFTFGLRHPYSKPDFTIRDKFHLKLEMTY